MKNIISLIFIVLFLSCDKYSRKDFSFERMDYEGDEIQINGYFYDKRNADEYEVFYLYRNGVVFGPHIYRQHTSQSDLEENLRSRALTHTEDGTPPDWGIFQVIDDDVILEVWDQIGGGPYPVHRMEGVIQENNTLDFSAINEGVFEFQEFSPKRDSTNQWIE